MIEQDNQSEFQDISPEVSQDLQTQEPNEEATSSVADKEELDPFEGGVVRLDVIWEIIWRNKLRIFLICLGVGIIACLIALSIPRYYQVEVKLAPEYNNGSSGMGSLGSLASMVGINIGDMQTTDAITPTFYPDLMKSTNFIVPLFDVEVRTKDGKFRGTLADYLTKHQKISFFDKIMAKFKKPKKEDGVYDPNRRVDPFRMNKAESDLAQGISGSIDCDVDKKTDIISITTTAQDPLVAALFADTVMARLQNFITDYRTQKARSDMEHLETLLEEAYEDYQTKMNEYATFVDTHQDLVLETYQSHEEALENEMQAAYNVYSTLQQQVQLANAKVQERTPVFTTIQNSTVPVKHAGPKRVIGVASTLLLTFCITVLVLIARQNKRAKQKKEQEVV